MTIAFSSFFSRFEKMAQSLKTLFGEVGNGQEAIIQDLLDAFDSDNIDLKESVDSLVTQFRSVQTSIAAAGAGLVTLPAKKLMLQIVKDDIGVPLSESESITEFVKQFNVSSTVESNTVSASVSLGSNTGTGTVVASAKDQYGRNCELMFAETMTLSAVSSSSFQVRGEQYVAPMNPYYPKGSGANFSITPIMASDAENFVTNGTISSVETYNANCPLGWIPTDTDATVTITNAATQQAVIAGTPTSGWWALNVINRHGVTYTTAPLTVGASASAVQAAIRLLPGFESVTVATTGTSPNYTYTVTYTGVPSPGTMTAINQFDVGTITIPVPTSPGQSALYYRSIKITGNGSEQTSFHIPVSPSGPFQYVIHTLLKKDTISTGVLEVSLRNGIDGTVITDDSGANCSGTVTLSGLAAGWQHFATIIRTPSVLPAQVYLRFKCTTAINSGGILWVNGLGMHSMQQVYFGGPSISIIEGDVAWVAGDSATVTVANNYSGKLHQWMDRFYGLKALGLQLDTSGSPTYSDGALA